LLTVKDLARFSLASRTCKILASTNSLWANFAVQLSLDPKIYHNQQSLQWGLLIHKTLQLPDRLGIEICKKIEELPFWEKELELRNNEPMLKDFLNESNGPQFFKAICQGDLCLIISPENKWDAKICIFNSKFNANSANEREVMFKLIGLSSSVVCFIRPPDERKQFEIDYYWKCFLKSKLSEDLNIDMS